MSYQIPIRIEQFLATLSKAYALDGEREKAELIVNGKVRIEEGTDSYSDFGNTDIGHTIHFSLPEVLFLKIYKRRSEIERDVSSELNNLISVNGEYVSNVRFEMDLKEDTEWRRESGLLLTGERLVTPEQEARIWEPNCFRLFISHRSRIKDEANKLRTQLREFGISAFVAHENIKPMREWIVEMENALSSMDGFVALMTNDFHESEWADQEVGYAFGRGVPIIAVRLERDPYGFLGKFQGLPANSKDLSKEIVSLLLRESSMMKAYVMAVEKCGTFDEGNRLSTILPLINRIEPHFASSLVNAFNTNSEVLYSFGFNGKKPSSYGGGLPEHLTRLTGNKYVITSSGEIAQQATT